MIYFKSFIIKKKDLYQLKPTHGIGGCVVEVFTMGLEDQNSNFTKLICIHEKLKQFFKQKKISISI